MTQFCVPPPLQDFAQGVKLPAMAEQIQDIVINDQQIRESAPFNMQAVTAQIRYNAPPQAKFEGDPRWVDLDWLYQSKRRFQTVNAEDFRRFIQAECDHGVQRFLVFYERGTGTWWVRTNDFAERRAARRAV